jgi:dynein light chain LC8-type
MEDNFSEINGKKTKLNVIKTDITEEMKIKAKTLAIESIEKFSIEKDMANFVKERFDVEYPDSWQCVVGIILPNF